LLNFFCANEVNYAVDFDNRESIREFLQSDGIYSVLIASKEEVLLEEYFNGVHVDSATNIQSLTKGIISLLIGIAIEQGVIVNEYDLIHHYFPQRFKSLEPEKRQIAIRHILDQTSGLAWRGFVEHTRWQQSTDPINYVLRKKLEAEPGAKYNYNSGAMHLLSGILASSSGITTLQFAERNLFDPLNITSVHWQEQNDGVHDGGGFGLEMRSKDLLKIGQMLLDNGCIKGQTVVSKNWVEKLFNGEEKMETNWGLRGSTHGMCWYQAHVEELEVNYGMGYGGQFIFIIPEQDLVIVVTHNHNTTKGVRQQSRFLREKLKPLIEWHKKSAV
ncbi:MAG: serine hydrolase, partial [Saprospiraceae bacterium]|nr:serine hydrolase [Saprospiraceae bacterium]